MCDKLCTLAENQSHCIKNHKFLILSIIEHVFTQVVPVPKPRAIELTEEEKYKSTRSYRRAEVKKEQAKQRAAEKQKKIDELKEAKKGIKSSSAKKGNETDDDGAFESKSSDKASFIGEEESPDFDEGKGTESVVLDEPCMWGEELTYELQVELLLTLQRLIEHFTAAAMSIQQSRSFDGVCIIVPGCIAALADAIIRQVAVDEPSEASAQLSGKTVQGRQLGVPGFGISIGSYATQVCTYFIFNCLNQFRCLKRLYDNMTIAVRNHRVAYCGAFDCAHRSIRLFPEPRPTTPGKDLRLGK